MPATAQRIAFLRGHEDAVVCLAVTPDSQLLASGAEVSLAALAERGLGVVNDYDLGTVYDAAQLDSYSVCWGFKPSGVCLSGRHT
jgi:hypothetical protein